MSTADEAGRGGNRKKVRERHRDMRAFIRTNMRTRISPVVVLLVLAVGACGEGEVVRPGGPGGPIGSGVDPSDVDVEHAEEVTCAEIEGFAGVLTDVGITYDYSASRSPAALAGTSDVVFGATLTGVVTDVAADDSQYVVYEADVARVVMGGDEVTVGDRVEVLVSYNGAQYDVGRYADAVRPGIEAAVFAHRHGPVEGWVASLEGFTVACEGGPLLGWTGFHDGWAALTSLDAVLDAAGSGGLDGPVVHTASSEGEGADGAVIEGTLVRDGDCLYVTADHPGGDPTAARYPVMWPHGTWWEPVLETVFVSHRLPVAVGEVLRAGGGFISDTSTLDLPAPALDHLTACLDDPSAEVAHVQTMGER